ncbi:hypothetical protein [Amycolatopsis sp. NPDC059657]|uniref:hypothetical protein n=1 Tax=Amycolatopsis sp. NPDC059657 TaxID=3346899 RepID=UPI00366EB529
MNAKRTLTASIIGSVIGFAALVTTLAPAALALGTESSSVSVVADGPTDCPADTHWNGTECVNDTHW